MSLTLYYHPLASFCWKVLIALYENDTPFEPVIVDLGNAESKAAFQKVWPVGKFPVLRDEARDRTVPESTIITEYLAEHFPGMVDLVPRDSDAAFQARLGDRFYDHYVHLPMQRIIADRLRPADKRDPYGVKVERAQIVSSYDIVEDQMADRPWAAGETYTMADCAASPALFYANKVQPFGGRHKNLAAYFGRLMQRPSFMRVVEEAGPYFKFFPAEPREM